MPDSNTDLGLLTVRVRVTEGDALYRSLVELADLNRQQAQISEKIRMVAEEIAEFVKVETAKELPS